MLQTSRNFSLPQFAIAQQTLAVGGVHVLEKSCEYSTLQTKQLLNQSSK
jgi:hypothetical protein